MLSANLCAGLVLWGAWISLPLAHPILPPDLSRIQLTWMFQDFMTNFNITYQSRKETLFRFKVFAQNLAWSRALQDSELGTAQYGVTPFSDLTESEFAKMSGDASLQAALPTRKGPPSGLPEPPKSCDWRKAGAMTAVKNQGRCRSCWAFATVSNVEALSNIHRSVPCNLSVQEVVDCTYPLRGGCSGGFVWDALLYIFSNGLSKSVLYPYAEKDQHCQKHRGRKLTKVDGFEVLPRDEKYIAKTVAFQGPVTALINKKLLQNYQKGIIQRPKEDCDPRWPDHAVVIAGFGEGKKRRGSWSGSYWIIQNSWGDHWGEKGYFRLHRGSNTCGISMFVTTATLTHLGERKPVTCPP